MTQKKIHLQGTDKTAKTPLVSGSRYPMVRAEQGYRCLALPRVRGTLRSRASLQYFAAAGRTRQCPAAIPAPYTNASIQFSRGRSRHGPLRADASWCRRLDFLSHRPGTALVARVPPRLGGPVSFVAGATGFFYLLSVLLPALQSSLQGAGVHLHPIGVTLGVTLGLNP